MSDRSYRTHRLHFLVFGNNSQNLCCRTKAARQQANRNKRSNCNNASLNCCRISGSRSSKVLVSPVAGKEMASPVGVEPTTCGLEVRCSIQLGYGLVVRL